MKNWKTLLFIALFLSGMTIEMFKGANKTTQNATSSTIPDVATLTAKKMALDLGYQVEAPTKDRSQRLAQRIRQQAKNFRFKRKDNRNRNGNWATRSGVQTTNFKHGTKSNGTKKKAKKISKKKKIVKKKVPKKPNVPQPQQANTEALAALETDEETTTEEELEQNTQYYGGGIGPQEQASNENEGDPSEKSLEEWIAILLPTPSLKATLQFIQDFQTGRVPASIFYEIATLMVEDSRNEMKNLGVRLYGQVATIEGFIGLAEISTGSFDSVVQQEAEKYLSRYREPKNLGILRRVITSGDNFSEDIKIVALRQAESSARANLSDDSVFILSNEGRFEDPNVQTYHDFAEALGNVLPSTSGEVANRTNDLLSLIQSIINNNSSKSVTANRHR